MARQNIRHNPAEKLFEAFMDFSGGLNTEITNEKLMENEFPVCVNVDLSGRSSARLRYGRRAIATCSGNTQGAFFYYRHSEEYPDIIMAVNGQLFVKENDSSTFSKITIYDSNNNEFTFQTSRTVEAIQYRHVMFVATGTKLVELEYDSGWKAKVVEPYTPTVMEAIYIGTNGLADNPDEYIQDGVSPTQNVEAIGIKPQYRTAAKNVPITMTAYINRPSGYTDPVEYKWEYKRSSDTEWEEITNFEADKRTVEISFDTATNYDIRVTVRKENDSNNIQPTQVYVLTGYIVKDVEDRTSVMPVSGIHTCNRIVLHWDRVLLYGDTENPFQMYISDLQNARYFPVSNTINFDTGKQEPITTAVRFQNMLVVFTKTTIQTLVGKSTEDYERYQIHDGIGCIAGWSAKVVGNYIIFLSHEGVHALRPNPYRLDTMNVNRVDAQIKSEMPTDENACAVVTDSQYWLAFPDRKTIYRYYYEQGVWVKDQSENLDIIQFLLYGEDAYNVTKNGNLYIHDREVYTDAGVEYDLDIETKLLDLSASFNYKKLKRIYILARHFPLHDVQMYVTVQADSSIVLSPDSGEVVIDDQGKVEWVHKTEPNFEFYTGTVLGAWVMGQSAFGQLTLSVQRATIRGKCRRVKVRFRGGAGKEFELFGFGLEFKLKKP